MDQKILERFFKGKCSPEEQNKVMAWYLSGQADTVLSERIDDYWKREDKPICDEWGKEAIFDAINYTMHASVNEKKIINMHGRTLSSNRWRRLFYAAAIALFIVLSSWWYFNISEEHVNQPSAEISYISKRTARGEKRTITLDDGSLVKLNADSHLWYAHTFGQDSVREVYLEGEAFFNVVRDTLHPFHIHTGNLTTMVLGTSFNIQAFAPDGKIAVSVVSGEVKVEQKNASHEQMVYLLPGEQAVYVKKDTVITKNRFDYLQVLSWKDGTLYFKNAKFSDIVSALERWYGVEIEVKRQGIEDGFSGSYTHRSLESVLEGISFVLNFEYEIHGRKTIIH